MRSTLPERSTWEEAWIDLARRNLQVSLVFLQSTPPSADTAQCLLSLAWIALGEGWEAEAEAYLQDAALMVENVQALMPEYQRVAGALALSCGDLKSAHRRFVMVQVPEASPSTMAYSWEGLAIIAAQEGEIKDAQLFSARAAACRVKSKVVASPWWQRKIEAAMAGVAELTEIQPIPAEDSPTWVSSQPGRMMKRSGKFHEGPACDGTKGFRKAEPTVRERTVADLVARGMSNRQIARHLDVSERTVESHLANLRAKLDLQSRAQVAIWSARDGVCRCRSDDLRL